MPGDSSAISFYHAGTGLSRNPAHNAIFQIQGLNSRLREIVSDLAKITARAELEKEAAEIRLITETPVIKHAEP